MKGIYIGVVIIIAVLIITGGLYFFVQKTEESSDFVTFTSEEGGFSVSMPPNPKSDIQTIPTEIVDIKLYSFVIYKISIAYMVAYNDYPQEIIDTLNTTADDMLEGSVAGAIIETNTELIDKKDINVAGYPGKEFTSQNGNFKIRQRVILKGNRLYQQVITATGDRINSEKANEFFNSFKLI